MGALEPGRLRKVLQTLMPLLLGVLGLLLLDVAADAPAPAARQLAPLGAGRLIVVMLDSLDERDVTRASMPLFSRYIARGALHGPVRACIDALTVPCVAAMLTGHDRASAFAALRNFVPSRSLVESSLLGALRERGVRISYFGEETLGSALLGVDENVQLAGDQRVVQEAMRSLARPGPSLTFVHLLTLDEAAHKLTSAGPGYQRALLQVDRQLAGVFQALRPHDHLVVLGDHGHSPSGRHIAGLGVQTYAAYFGPRFSRGGRVTMTITDHASLWAQLFGLRWLPVPWVDDYFAGRSSGSEPRLPRVAPLLPHAPLILLGVVVLACLMVGGRLLSERALLRTALLGLKESDAGERGLTLALLAGLLLPVPVLGTLGGPLLGQLWVVALLCHAALSALRRRASRQAAALAAALVVALALLPVRIDQHLPRAFLVHEQVLGALSPQLAPLLPISLLLAALRSLGCAPVLAALLGALLASVMGLLPGLLQALPCALLLPLALSALRLRRWLPAVLLLLPPAMWTFVQRDAAALTPLCSLLLLWSLLPMSVARANVLLTAGLLVWLVWMTFWCTMGTRLGGVDFDFYFSWLPTSASATSQLVPQALLTVAKYLSPIVCGVLLAQRRGVLPRALFDLAELIATCRLGGCLVFAALSPLSCARNDPAWLGDVRQEVLFFLLLLSVLGLSSVGARLAPPAHVT